MCFLTFRWFQTGGRYESGGDAVTVVPTDRWDIDTNTSALGLHRRRDPDTEQYSRHGSFIGDIDHFDCGFFGVDATEAGLIDPQQRMILKVRAERGCVLYYIRVKHELNRLSFFLSFDSETHRLESVSGFNR